MAVTALFSVAHENGNANRLADPENLYYIYQFSRNLTENKKKIIEIDKTEMAATALFSFAHVRIHV